MCSELSTETQTEREAVYQYQNELLQQVVKEAKIKDGFNAFQLVLLQLRLFMVFKILNNTSIGKLAPPADFQKVNIDN